MRWLEGAARSRLTEPSCGRKVNMLAEPEPAAGFGKGSEAAVADVPDAVPAANSQDVRRAVACRHGGARRVAKPVRATPWWLQVSASDDCAIIRRFHLSAAGFGNVPFRFASTIDSLLSASVGNPESGGCGQWSGRDLR